MRSGLRSTLLTLLVVSGSQAAPARGWWRWLGFGGEDNQHVLTDEPKDGDGPLSSLKHLDGYVAFGDSYSAGIGTGVDGKEEDCRQGNGAYPQLIYKDLSAGQEPNSTVKFQWLSCTGSTTEQLLHGGATSQIDDFNIADSVDFATLSVGGNDLGFFDVMNACVFRFYNFYSGTCEAALEKSEALVASPDFEERLHVVLLQILDRVQWEKKPWFVITLTGYARFFNADTEECNECSMGVWWKGPKLVTDIRMKMNWLVLETNKKLRKTAELVNSQFAKPKVLFVDYDAEFDGHRFCEPNVTEPDYTRNDTYFFLVGGVDSGQNGTTPNGTFDDILGTEVFGRAPRLSTRSPLVDPDTCLQSAQRSGDWGELAVCYMAISKRQDPELRPANDQVSPENSMWYVPTYYGKTFHPRSDGHKIIRDKIYEVWRENGL